MADALTEFDMEALHDAIAAQISAQFPELQTVEFYREETDRKTPVTAPACLLELTELDTTDVDPDPGTGQLAACARFEARLILGFRTQRVGIEARKLAGALAAFLHLKRWTVDPVDQSLVTGPGDVAGCYKDEFDSALDQYEVWRVDWSHIVHLGSSVWKPEGITPTTVYTRAADPEGGILGDPEQVQP